MATVSFFQTYYWQNLRCYIINLKQKWKPKSFTSSKALMITSKQLRMQLGAQSWIFCSQGIEEDKCKQNKKKKTSSGSSRCDAWTSCSRAASWLVPLQRLQHPADSQAQAEIRTRLYNYINWTSTEKQFPDCGWKFPALSMTVLIKQACEWLYIWIQSQTCGTDIYLYPCKTQFLQTKSLCCQRWKAII